MLAKKKKSKIIVEVVIYHPHSTRAYHLLIDNFKVEWANNRQLEAHVLKLEAL